MAGPHDHRQSTFVDQTTKALIDYFRQGARLSEPQQLLRQTLIYSLKTLESRIGGIWLHLSPGYRGRVMRGLPPYFATPDWRSWLTETAPIPRFFPLSDAHRTLSDPAVRSIRSWPALPADAGLYLHPLTLEGQERGVYIAITAGRPLPRAETMLADVFDYMPAIARRLVQLKLRRRSDRTVEEPVHKRESFLPIITHELKTPLNSIIGYTELLLSDKAAALSPQTQDYLQQIRLSAQQQLKLIKNLLSLTSLSSGLVRSVPTCVSVHRLIRQLVEQSKSQYPQRIRSVHYDLESGTEHVFVDGRLLRQLLAHLIENAFKFSPDGGELFIQAHLEQSTSGTRPFLFWTIRNQGQGIPRKYREQIFQPFFQMDQSLTRSYDGIGLGLYQCRRICEILGGTIDYSSQAEDGTTFIVKLPVESDASAVAGISGPTADR
ncbi:MAG: HAMP domain-containing histidine kinase [Acidobacteria bacterium]|nr:HAMP domain-containing histidine kinase [Acidobacteriota bacterium]